MNFALLNRYLKIFSSYYTGYPIFKPDTISVVVSNSCNLKCLMCDFWKDNKKDSVLTIQTYRNFLKDVADYGVKKIQFTGGEPLLNKEIYELLISTKEFGLSTMMVTNGTLISAKNVEPLIKNLDTVYISVDAPNEKQHDKIRGIEGAFKKTTNGIKLLVDTRNKHSLKTRIIVCSTIVPDGIHDPEDMFNLIKEIGADWVIYNPASSVSYGNTQLKDKFSDNHISMDRYDSMINKIIKIMEGPSNLIRSNPFYLESSKEFLRLNKKYIFIPCYGGGYNGPLLSVNGEVFPCCAWNKPIGNIKEKPFSAIWESVEAKEIRKKIRAKQCPMCHHHTRTFDYIIYSPFLIKNPLKLLKGYRKLASF